MARVAHLGTEKFSLLVSQDRQRQQSSIVDLLFGQVIYVFVCGKGGRNVWVRRGVPRKKHLYAEKIDEFELADRFAEGVREAKQLGVDVGKPVNR